MSFSTKCILFAFLFAIILAGLYKYNSVLETNGKLKCEAAVYADTLDYKEWSAGISDEVIKEFVDDKVANNVTLERTRKEAIDEYFKDDAVTGAPKTSPVPVTDPDSSVRVVKLADRMLEYYCSARPKDIRCNPVSPTDGVSDLPSSNR